MGWQSQIDNLVIVETGGPGFTGFFIYDPAPGANNLLASITGLGTAGGTSTPYLVASNAAPGGAGTTLVLTVITATTAGDEIQVSADAASGGPAVTGITDFRGNVYTSRQAGGTLPGSIWTSPGTTALQVGDTITLTYALATGAKAAAAVGIPLGVSLDNVPTFTQGTSTAPSITTGTLGQPNEVVLATLASGNAGGVPVWPAGWTVLATVHRAASSDQYLSVAYKNVTAAAPVTVTPTIVSAAWTMLAATFKETSGISGTDPYGNQVISGGAAFYELPDSTGELTFVGPDGYQMRSGQTFEGGHASIVQSVNGSGQLVMSLQGFQANYAGFTDRATLDVLSSSTGGVNPAQVEMSYTDINSVKTPLAVVDYGGLNAIGLGTGADPTVTTGPSQAAQPETWKSLGSITATGFTASFGQYRFTFEGELEVDVLLTANGGGGTAGTYSWGTTLAAVYRPPTTRIYPLGFNATLASGVSNALIVNSSGVVQVKLGALPAGTIVGTTVRVPLNI